MIRVVGLRLVAAVATLLVASVVIFGATDLLPGDAATAFLGREGSPAAVAALRKDYGLDRSAESRYATWISGVLRGDLGRSVATGTSVTTLIARPIENTSILVLATLALLVPLSLFVGTFAGLRRGSRADVAIQLFTVATAALPEFGVGVALILLFALVWPLFPAVSLDVSVRSLVLPTASLLLLTFAYTTRMVRAGVIDALESDHVEMARLKGLPERLVIRRHVLPNALGPTAQAFALTTAWLVGGIVIVENLFAYPGVGNGLVQAITSRDNATVESLTLLLAAVYVVGNLLADLFTLLVTPRLRTRVG
jgi:peptide/nickel transport system permease protein